MAPEESTKSRQIECTTRVKSEWVNTALLYTLLTNMSVESFTGSGVELHIPDLAVLAEGSPDVSLHQLIPGSALKCEMNSYSAIPDT